MWDRIKRWRWAIGITAVLLLGLVYAFWPTATAADTAMIARGPMSVGVTDDGITRADEYYVISAPVTGYVSRIELEPGDPVGRGDVERGVHLGGLVTDLGDVEGVGEILGVPERGVATAHGSSLPARWDTRRPPGG